MKVKDNIRDIIEAIKETAKGNYVSDEVEKERITICMTCEKLVVIPVIRTRHCSECLCDIDIKTMYKKMECPLGKWHGEE